MTRTYSDVRVATTVRAVAVVAVTSILLTSVACAAKLVYPDERLNTTILLHQTEKGCVAYDPIAIRSKTSHRVSWSISNMCEKPQRVRVDNFRMWRPDGTLGNPEGILEYTGETEAAVANNAAGVIPPVQVVKQPSSETFYRYDILVSEDSATWKVAADPDIDIWP